MMIFPNGYEIEGFYWSAERRWYKSEGSKARWNAVFPVEWEEIKKGVIASPTEDVRED
jgi:hypothetical protein